MSKINLHDTLMDIMIKMSDGNPGAAMALAELAKIDPESMFEDVSTILLLDAYEIYGTDIYVLYSDKCNRDVRKLIMLCRAVQLGFLPSEKLKEMSEDQMYKVNLTNEEFEELDKKVCDMLTELKKHKEL